MIIVFYTSLKKKLFVRQPGDDSGIYKPNNNQVLSKSSFQVPIVCKERKAKTMPRLIRVFAGRSNNVIGLCFPIVGISVDRFTV